MKKFILLLFTGAVIFMGCGRTSDQHVDDSTGIAAPTVQIDDADSANDLTSDTAVLARQDSLRQDSLNRNFSTPDLALFDVHGKVKSIVYVTGSKENMPLPFFKLNYTFKFTEQGQLEDLKSMIRKVIFDENYNYYITAKTNSKRELTKVLLEWERNSGEDGEAFICSLRFNWKNGKIIKFQEHATHETKDFVISYDNNRINQIKEEFGDQGSEITCKYKFEGYKFDQTGNWIECDIIFTKNGVSLDRPIKEQGKIHVKRNIEYY